MNVQKALKLKKGDVVHCPADRGEPNFCGKVVTEAEIIKRSTISKNHQGQEYIWIEVQTLFGNKSVWPSNRLNTRKG